MAEQQSNLTISDLVVQFGGATAVHGANLSIEHGEFFTLLGPSGCGKTTILRTIAGFNRQESGSIAIGSTSLDALPPHRRDTGLVFQNYAVFPHLTVAQNVAYGLKSKGVRGSELKKRVAEAIEMVDLNGLEDRLPKQLSGGQQQRVVIARAIVVRPRVLLMDEPLANLDAKLRVKLRRELKELQATLGITTVYVTHDQEEALSLSDRVAVMSGGHVLQVGTPSEIYRRPATLGVAEFIGEANFFRATLSPNRAAVPGAGGEAESVLETSNRALSGAGWVGFRPEEVHLVDPGAVRNGLVGTILAESYLGSFVRYEVDCGLSRPVSIQVPVPDEDADTFIGRRIGIEVPTSRTMVFPGSEEESEL